jgi:hypothetical protein
LLLIHTNAGDSTNLPTTKPRLKPVVDGPQIWQRRGMTPVAETRILLCRPQGGLNDILSEIGKCLSYARRFDRLVIVETDYVNLTHFNDRFETYFKSTDPRLILDAADFSALFDQLRAHPEFIHGRVNGYRDRINLVGVDDETGRHVTFDFTQDYEAPLIVHHANGQQKGRNAMIALQSLALSDALKAQLKNRMERLGPEYSAIHIRHTDYKTDYKNRIERLKLKNTGPVFIATDNRAVLDYCTSFFGEARVFSLSHLPDDGGAPLHYSRSAEGARQRNSDAVLDLFTLTLATDYYFFPRLSGRWQMRPSYSGFSVLADRLRHAPRLLSRIVKCETDAGRSDAGFISNTWRELWGR